VTVKICNSRGFCIRCAGTAYGVAQAITNASAKGSIFACCGTECVRIDQIATIVEERKAPDDDREGGRPIFGNPDVVIFTGGQMALPQRRAPHPEAEPVMPVEGEEPEGLRFVGGESSDS
jgi:hypothetical protein